MKKRADHLWPRVTEFPNLELAFRKAARGKRGRQSVAAFEAQLEANLLRLQAELQEGRYQPGKYVSFYIHDPKRRLISAAPFRDRVVHHALINLIGPIYERKFIGVDHGFGHLTQVQRMGKERIRACKHKIRSFPHSLYLCLQTTIANGRNDD